MKSELEEKQETKDLARYATQLTQGYFAEFEKVLLSLDENVQIRDALAALDTAACALQSLCSFEYCIERHAGENQRHLLLMKQSGSKPFLLSQDIKESASAVDFKHLAHGIAEKSLSFFVSKQMHTLKAALADQLLTAFSPEPKRIDAIEYSRAILDCVTRKILEASP